jgi:hypothetical protein
MRDARSTLDERSDVHLAYIFGSTAADRAHRTSDVDVALLFDAPPDPKTLGARKGPVVLTDGAYQPTRGASVARVRSPSTPSASFSGPTTRCHSR